MLDGDPMVIHGERVRQLDRHEGDAHAERPADEGAALAGRPSGRRGQLCARLREHGTGRAAGTPERRPSSVECAEHGEEEAIVGALGAEV